MTFLLFTLIAILYGALTLYFAWRYLLRRRLPSLLCAMLPAGWVIALAREMHWLPRNFTTPLYCLSGVVGIVGVLIVLHHEAQQPRPFR